jgi:hypothetical protein
MNLVIAILILSLTSFADNFTIPIYPRFMDGSVCDCDSIHRTYYYDNSLGIIQSERPYKDGVNVATTVVYYWYANSNKDKTRITRIALYVNNVLIKNTFPNY